MKKLLIALIALFALALCVCACADELPYEVFDGTLADFDFDGVEDALALYFETDANGDGWFSVSVNGIEHQFTDCVSLAGTAYAFNLKTGAYYTGEYYYGTLIMIPQYGLSDDPCTYCLVYTLGNLYYAGEIYSVPEAMLMGDDGMIHTSVRAMNIGTWSRPADYKLGFGYYYDEVGNTYYEYMLTEVPRDTYPMGMVVTLNCDIYASTAKNRADYAVLIPGGQQVCLAATDDVRWLYVTDAMGNAGWLSFDSTSYPTIVDIGSGTYADLDDVFSNIIYAD